MPNFDAGHYFLTVLAPIKAGSCLIGKQSRSRRHLIREFLANMPAGESTAAAQGEEAISPFAGNTRTHFARFVVLDDVVFNGRVSGDAILDLVRRRDPMQAQPVDRLSTPFLIFCVDFDADSGTDDELKKYLGELWSAMSPALDSIFQHCEGFDGVKSADGFFGYIKKCQIETTMPFNDYWSAPVKLNNIDLIPYGIGAGLAALLFAAGLVSCHLRLSFLGLLVLAAVGYLAYRKVAAAAEIPFPISPAPAPGSDLPTVLKALHLQRAFTDLAISVQGRDDQALYDAFATFLADTKPGETTAPTQAPGVIGV